MLLRCSTRPWAAAPGQGAWCRGQELARRSGDRRRATSSKQGEYCVRKLAFLQQIALEKYKLCKPETWKNIAPSEMISPQSVHPGCRRSGWSRRWTLWRWTSGSGASSTRRSPWRRSSISSVWPGSQSKTWVNILRTSRIMTNAKLLWVENFFLSQVFTQEVFKGLLGFSTWWCCFVWFSSAAIGVGYQSYFYKV